MLCQVSDMREEGVLQPLLVTQSAVTLATECVRMILKVGAAVELPPPLSACVADVLSDTCWCCFGRLLFKVYCSLVLVGQAAMNACTAALRHASCAACAAAAEQRCVQIDDIVPCR